MSHRPHFSDEETEELTCVVIGPKTQSKLEYQGLLPAEFQSSYLMMPVIMEKGSLGLFQLAQILASV